MATTSTTTTPTSSAIHHCVTLIQWLDSTYLRACVSNSVVVLSLFTDLQEVAPMAGRRTRTNTIMPWNMPAGRLNPTIGFGGKGRRSLCAVRCRDVAIYRRLEGVPVDECRSNNSQALKRNTPLIQRLTSA